MTSPKQACFLITLLCISLLLPMRAGSQANSSANETQHDGAHDFDFEIGTWKT